MMFESHVPAKKGKIGFAKPAAVVTSEVKPEYDDFFSFMDALEGIKAPLTLSNHGVADKPGNVSTKVAVFRKHKVLTQSLGNTNLPHQHTLLDQIHVEANFNLLSLLSLYANQISSSAGSSYSSWVYPDAATIQHCKYPADPHHHLKKNSINKHTYWSQATTSAKSNNMGKTTTQSSVEYEKHIQFVQATYLKWQQAFFSVLTLFSDREISRFHFIGESCTSEMPMPGHGVFVSAVFTCDGILSDGSSVTTSASNNSINPQVDSFSCVLIGVRKHLRQRLVDCGAQPRVLTDLNASIASQVCLLRSLTCNDLI